MSKTIYITEEQEQELIDKYLTEALIVNSEQVSDIVNYLNSEYHPYKDKAGQVGIDGLVCPSLAIDHYVDGEPVQKLQRKDLLNVINLKYKPFVSDDASRLAYFDQILTDWLNGDVKKTGQLSVNYIDDSHIAKFRKEPKNDKPKSSNSEEDKKSDNNKNNKKSKDTK